LFAALQGGIIAGMRLVRLVAYLLAAAGIAVGCQRSQPSLPALTVLQVAVVREPAPDEIATGFALGPGRVITVAHVLVGRDTGTQVRVRPPGAHEGGRLAAVVEIDQRDDLAVLSVPGLLARGPFTGAPTKHAVILVLRGSRVRRVPAQVIRSVTARISTPDGRHVVRRPALVLRTEVLPGDSGAPVLTSDDHVAGVVFARDNLRPGIAYAVDASAFARL
jgi:hypothetical protein